MKKIIILMVVFFFLVGCASTTVINSDPPGAGLYLAGQYKGVTPYTYTDMSPAGTWTVAILKLDGYKDFNSEIRRDELSVPALIGGCLVLVPFIWILKYPPQYTFKMEKLK